jgi:hypothetical protein
MKVSNSAAEGSSPRPSAILSRDFTDALHFVMPGSTWLDPGIHARAGVRGGEMDCRVKPGNDGGGLNISQAARRVRFEFFWWIAMRRSF